MRFRLSALAGLLIAVFLAAYCPAWGAEHVVNMDGISFSPASITVNEGDSVTWHNISSFVHSSSSGTPCTSDGLWNSPDLSPGGSFTQVFTTTGAYPYFCRQHCGFGMTGDITVQQDPTGIGDRVAAHFALGASVPNPFNPETRIPYSLGEGARVEIAVFNALGERVATLVDAFKTQGDYFAVWNGRSRANIAQASGIYFYRMTVNGSVIETRKMVLLK